MACGKSTSPSGILSSIASVLSLVIEGVRQHAPNNSCPLGKEDVAIIILCGTHVSQQAVRWAAASLQMQRETMASMASKALYSPLFPWQPFIDPLLGSQVPCLSQLFNLCPWSLPLHSQMPMVRPCLLSLRDLWDSSLGALSLL